MLYEIDVNSAYIFISSACTIGLLFGMYNWYTVLSIEVKNEINDKNDINQKIEDETKKEDEKKKFKQIDEKTLADLLKYCNQIREVI